MTRQLPSQDTSHKQVKIDYEYHPESNTIKKKTYTDGSFEYFEYDQFNQETRLVDRLGRVELKTYDQFGNLTSEAEGLVVGEDYQDSSQDSQTNAYAIKRYEYYADGETGARLKRYEYDYNGNRQEFIYNSDRQLIEILEPNDSGEGYHTSWSYTYDSSKRLATSTDALGRTTTYSYDDRDRQIATTYNDDSTEFIFYGIGRDANLIVKRKDRNGNTTVYNYDEAGRKIKVIKAYSVMNTDGTSETVNDSTVQLVSSYSYLSGTKKILSKVVAGERTEYSYDYRNRVISTTVYPREGKSLTSEKPIMKID